MTFFRACSLGGLAVLFLTVPASFGLAILGDRAVGDLEQPLAKGARASKGARAFRRQAKQDDDAHQRLIWIHGAVDLTDRSERKAKIERLTVAYRGLVEAGETRERLGAELAYQITELRDAQREAIIGPIRYLGVLLLILGACGALSAPKPAQQQRGRGAPATPRPAA